MAKLTYFNIIMLCGLLTAYNMHAADAANVPGAFATTTLNRFVNDAKQAGYLEGMQDALATTRPTFTESLANLKDLASDQLSSAAAAAQAKLAPYTQAAQTKFGPYLQYVKTRVAPYTGYVTGPANTLASSLARAATATGGAITGGVAGGLEKLTTKAGVQEWLNSAAAQQYLQDNFPDIVSTLQKVDRQTYEMILGGVALAVGTYLAGKGLAAGYNYLTSGPTVLRTATKLQPEPKYFARKADETLQSQILRLIKEENNIKLERNTFQGELKNPLLADDQKDALLSTMLAYDTELALLSNKINQLRQEEQNIASGTWRTSGSLEQRIAQTTAARDKAESEMNKLFSEGKNTAFQYAQKTVADLNAQLAQLTAQLPAQPAVQPTAPQQEGFFGRIRAKLPSVGMPSLFRRAPAAEAPAMITDIFEQTQAERQIKGLAQQIKLLKEKIATNPQENAALRPKIENMQATISNIVKLLPAEDVVELSGTITEALTPIATSNWRSYLRTPSFGGWFSSKSAQEPTSETQVSIQEPSVAQQPATGGWRSYLRTPSFGGWFSRKTAQEPASGQ